MKLAVFYHCWLPSPHALSVCTEQLVALRDSGLESAADEIHIGLNGDPLDSCLLQMMIPKATIHSFGQNEDGECPTMFLLEQWARGKTGWAVCYHHIKGASNISDLAQRWRRCMEKTVIWNWETCTKLVDNGFDTVGNHWYRYMDQQYWAGNFWWASAEYLNRLPTMINKTVAGHCYEAEVWIGKCGFHPRLRDFATHPFMKCPP